MSKFEQFFSSDKLMLASFIVSLAAFAVHIVLSSISVADNLQSIYYVAFAVIMFFISVSMYRSFISHETSAMNIVTGAAIGILLVFELQRCVINIASMASLRSVINTVIIVVLYAILLVNHVQINSIHRSTRGKIIFNQVVLIVIAAYQIYLIISGVVLLVSSPDSYLSCFSRIAGALAKMFISFMIICIETKLNAYKIDRDVAKAEGTWTDEKKSETKEKYFGK